MLAPLPRKMASARTTRASGRAGQLSGRSRSPASPAPAPGAAFLGTAVHQVSTVVTIAGGVLVAVVVVVLIFYLRRHMKRLEHRPGQAYPGPLDDAKASSSAR